MRGTQVNYFMQFLGRLLPMPYSCTCPCPLLLNHLSSTATTISTTFSCPSASGKVKDALLKAFHIGHAQ